MIRRLIERFSNFIPNGKADQIEEEFALYQTTLDLPPNILVNTRVDVFLGCKIGKIESSTGKPFGLLSDFMKCLLCVPHGNADSEKMFSYISLIITDRRSQLDTSTVEAYLNIKLNSNCADCRQYEPLISGRSQSYKKGYTWIRNWHLLLQHQDLHYLHHALLLLHQLITTELEVINSKCLVCSFSLWYS